MFRLFGFLVGVAVATMILLAALDEPELGRLQQASRAVVDHVIEETELAESAQEILDTPIPELLAGSEPEEPMPEPAGSELVQGNESFAHVPDPIPSAVADTLPENVVAWNTPAQAVAQPVGTMPPPVEVQVVNAPIPQTLDWELFWNPFHSRLSASGFAERLERLTGLDYRVTEIEPGRYQVAFAHVGEDERIANLQRIEDATGLSLLERRP